MLEQLRTIFGLDAISRKLAEPSGHLTSRGQTVPDQYDTTAQTDLDISKQPIIPELLKPRHSTAVDLTDGVKD